MNKEQFLKTEFGGELESTITAWDDALSRNREDKEVLRTLAWCQAQWEVYRMAIKHFYGVEYHFTRTGRERQMRTIEQFQIRKIYAIGNALGIKASGSEDELHALVGGVTGKDSIKSLTYQEACAVIARLEELQGKTVSPKPRNSKPKEHETRPGGVTSGQQKKIWFLMYELKKCDEVPNDVQLGDRLCAVIKKEFGADAVARNPFAWITFEQGNNLIEILKRYVASARKRGEA